MTELTLTKAKANLNAKKAARDAAVAREAQRVKHPALLEQVATLKAQIGQLEADQRQAVLDALATGDVTITPALDRQAQIDRVRLAVRLLESAEPAVRIAGEDLLQFQAEVEIAQATVERLTP